MLSVRFSVGVFYDANLFFVRFMFLSVRIVAINVFEVFFALYFGGCMCLSVCWRAPAYERTLMFRFNFSNVYFESLVNNSLYVSIEMSREPGREKERKGNKPICLIYYNFLFR